MSFPIPYYASLSPKLRLALSIVGSYESIQRHVEACVQTINDKPDVAISLKSPTPGHRLIRQIDLRANPDGPILAKVYVSWDWRRNCWFVMVEGSEENYWEEFNGGRIDPALN